MYLPNVNANGTIANPNLVTGAGLDGVPDLEFAQIRTRAPIAARSSTRGEIGTSLPRDQVFGEFFSQKINQASFDAIACGRTGYDSAVPSSPIPRSVLSTFTLSVLLLINEVRANNTRFADNQIPIPPEPWNWGVPACTCRTTDSARLDFSIRSGNTTPYTAAENTYEARDMLTKVLGPALFAHRRGGATRAGQ